MRAQIGLTALAYERCYPLLRPSMKIDQWIGCMYAVMNTCQELQRVGVDPGELETAYAANAAAVEALQAKCVLLFCQSFVENACLTRCML